MPSFLCPLLYFIDDWMRVVDRRQLDAYCVSGVGNAASGSGGGAWKTPQPLQQGAAAAAATETDLFTWMKLLFVPAFAAFLLAAALLEDCFFGPHSSNNHNNPHSHHPTHPAAAPSGIRAWIRQFCNRGPKLTTAYQNQMKLQQASAAASKQFHAANLNHLSGTGSTCNCGANHSNSLPGDHSSSSLVHDASHSNSIASSSLSTAGSASSPSSGALSSTSSGGPLSLHLNFNGFNQLSGPLQYYHTFTREDDLNAKQIKASNGKDHALSSPVSASAPSPVPSSEFIRITLTNDSTGFNQTFSLWSGLNFGEILAYYVSQYWNDERRKYDSIEGSNAWIVSPSPSMSPSPAASEPNSSGNNSDADDTEQSPSKPNKKKKSKSKSKNSVSNADKQSSNHPFLHNPPLILTYKGIRVSPILTPAAIFNPNELASFSTSSTSSSSIPASSATFEISPNYFSLFDRLRVESMADLKSHHTSLKSSLDLHKKLLDEVSSTDAEIIVLQKKEKELQDKYTLIQNSELKLLKKNVEKTQKDLNQLQSSRQDLETTMHHSVGVIRNLKLKLEQEHVGLKDDVEALEKEYAAAKAAYAQAMDARHECSNELKAVMINYENNQKKLNALKVQKIKHEKLGEKVKKIQAVLATTPGATNPAPTASAQNVTGGEVPGTNVSSPAGSTGPSSPSSAATSAAASAASSAVTSPTSSNDLVATAPQRMRARYEQLETDHNVLNVHLNELRLASHEIDDLSKNETYKLRYRLKLLEKDLRDLAKWKSVARAHELDARESVRWKLALKQAKNRERGLEREAREAAHWRLRARAMEREVRELRNWKRQMDGGMLGGANDDTLSAGSNPASSLSHSNSGEMDALLRGFGFGSGINGTAGTTSGGSVASGSIESDPLALALGDNVSSYDVDDFADDTALMDQELLFGSNMDKFSSTFPSWYNGAQLSTSSPAQLSRGLDPTPNPAGTDVGAGAAPSNEQDPEFTHTLPAFLAD